MEGGLCNERLPSLLRVDESRPVRCDRSRGAGAAAVGGSEPGGQWWRGPDALIMIIVYSGTNPATSLSELPGTLAENA